MKYLITFFEELGSAALFVRKVVQTFLRTQGNLRPILQQVSYVSFRSLSTVAFAGIFVGAILVLQFQMMLSKYDALMLLGGLNTSALVREVGPLIISFLLAGKIGAFTAAELGTMKVTEQIEAIECLGTDPIQYLIVPRFFAIIISSLILLVAGLMISVVGAMISAQVFHGVNYLEYLNGVPRFTSFFTLFSGMIKSLVYGVIVATVSCHRGFTTTGGARGVGRSVTSAAIYTNFYIVLANYVTSALLEYAQTFKESFG